MCISKAEPSVTATQKMQTYARLWAIHRILYFNPGGWGAGSGLADNFKFMEGLSLIATFLTGKYSFVSTNPNKIIQTQNICRTKMGSLHPTNFQNTNMQEIY